MTDLARSAEHQMVEPFSPAVPDFEGVYRAEFAYVYRVLRYLGVRHPDIEDLAHDVFVVVHRRLGDFDATRPIRPWLSGIAYHVVARHRQRFSNRNEVPTGEALEPPSQQLDAADQVAAAEAWAIVCAAVQVLPLEQRVVLVMHDIEGHAAPEIATAVDAPLNTVYSRLRLARARFSEEIRRRGLGGGEP